MEGNDVDKSIVERLRMDMDRLIDAVCEMRHAQMEFFRSRSRSALEASRRRRKKWTDCLRSYGNRRCSEVTSVRLCHDGQVTSKPADG